MVHVISFLNSKKVVDINNNVCVIIINAPFDLNTNYIMNKIRIIISYLQSNH